MSGSRYVQPYIYAYTSTGVPVPFALLNFYVSGSSTRAPTYSDLALTSPNANPVVADSTGTFPPIYLDPAVTYKAVLTTPAPLVGSPVTIWTDDPAGEGGGGSLAGLEATYVAAAGQAVFTSPVASPASTAIYRNGSRLAASDFTASGRNVALINGCDAGDTVVVLAAEPVGLLANAPVGSINLLSYMQANATTSADQTVALAGLQSAIAQCLATGNALYVPRGVVLRVNGTATIAGPGISIIGGGEIISTVDLPIFRVTGACAYQTFDFAARFDGLAGTATAAAGIELSSQATTDFIQYNRFRILARGGFAVRNTSITRTTGNGPENMVNWNTFELTALDGAALVRNAYYATAGSGTGNVWLNPRGSLGAVGSAYLRFDGVGAVVGDIIVLGGHMCASAGGSVDCAAVEIGPSTIYRHNISVVGCQSDAQMTRVFRLSATGAIAYSGIHHDGSMIGGNTVMGIDLPVTNMTGSDRDSTAITLGKEWSTAATGAQTLACFKVTLGQYTGARLRLSPAGLVGGVSGGSAEIIVALRSDNATVTGTVVSTATDPAALFGATVTVVGLVATVNLTFTPSSGSSGGNVTCHATGRSFTIERL